MANIAGTPKLIKLLNKDIIISIIRANGPITKPEIARMTNLSLVTVNKTVEILLEEQKVKVSGMNESTGGRRAVFYEINEELYYFIGLYYDNDKYLGAISNSLGVIIHEESFPVRTNVWQDVMEDTYKAIDTLIKKCGDHVIGAIGIGVPGVVKDGVVSNIPNIPSWEQKNMAEILEEHYGIEVVLENDINMSAMGVYSQDYQEEVDSLVLIYFEQGIGSGLILNQELYKGATNFAGELSYLPVQDSISVDGQKTKYKGTFENRITLLKESLYYCTENQRSEILGILRKTIADALIAIGCMINPEIVVLKYEQLTNEDIVAIKEIVRNSMGEENMPKIIKIDDMQRYSLKGVIHTCMKETTPIYSLSDGKKGEIR